MKAQITEALRAKLATAHHLDGAMMMAPDGLPAIAFQLSHGGHECPMPGEDAKVNVGTVVHEFYPCVAMYVLSSAPALLVARLDLHSPEVSAFLANLRHLLAPGPSQGRASDQSSRAAAELPALSA